MSQQTTSGRIPQFTTSDRFRKARESVGLEQAELAERIGVSRTTISNYETGAVQPRRIVLRAWAMATGVDAHWLETGESPHPAGPDEGLELPRVDSNHQPSGLTPLPVTGARVLTFPGRDADAA